MIRKECKINKNNFGIEMQPQHTFGAYILGFDGGGGQFYMAEKLRKRNINFFQNKNNNYPFTNTNKQIS